MNVCLLCLKNVRSLEEFVWVNSEEWKQQNIEDLINIHLWPMQQINSSNSVCIECVGVLYNFHKFYKRVENAQKSYNAAIKNEDEKPDQKYLDGESIGPLDECAKIPFDKNVLKEDHLDPEMIMEQPLSTEFVIDGPYIKKEMEDSISCDDIHLKQSRKRGRPTKKASLKTIELRLIKTNTTKIVNKKMKKSSKLVVAVEADMCEHQRDLELETISNSETLLDPEDNDSDTCSEQQESPTKTTKKKNHRNPDEKTLKEYDKIIAENFKIFCNLCQIEVDNFLSLRKHFKMNHNQRGYARCCKRNFFTRSLLVDHINVHLNPNYFKCQQCSKVFSDRSRFLCHKKLHEDDSKLDKCDICGKLFADKGALKKHVLIHSSEKLFPCRICGKFFTNCFILNHHIEAVHQNKFVQICEVCGKSIRCPTAFASHMEKHEVKTTPINCDVCGLLLTNKEGLKRHKNSQHPEGGKKEHTCHICSKVSPTQRALKAHIRTVHEQGFDFKCNLCEKSFKRPAALREHVATHTGNALYTCPWCPRTFMSNGNMYNHRKNAHPKEWEELKRQKYAGTVS